MLKKIKSMINNHKNNKKKEQEEEEKQRQIRNIAKQIADNKENYCSKSTNGEHELFLDKIIYKDDKRFGYCRIIYESYAIYLYHCLVCYKVLEKRGDSTTRIQY